MTLNGEMKTVIESISSALYSYKHAVSANAGIYSAKDRLKNLLFTYCEKLIAAALEAEHWKNECEEHKKNITVFEEALAESDEENARLKKELKELKALKDLTMVKIKKECEPATKAKTEEPAV